MEIIKLIALIIGGIAILGFLFICVMYHIQTERIIKELRKDPEYDKIWRNY